MRYLSLFGLFSGLFLCVNLAYGHQMPWTHYGLRPLGMGNAFVAVADDYNALFYNPAGMARLKEWDGELINPRLIYSTNLMSAVKDASNLMNNSSDSSQGVLNLLDKETGQNLYAALGLTPHLIFKHFGFGIGLDIVGEIAFHRYPSVDINFGPRVIIPISFAANFLEDRLSLGITLKSRVTGGIDHEFSIQDIQVFKKSSGTDSSNSSLKDYVQAGIGYGIDLGMLFTPMKEGETTLGVSITDVGGTRYTKMKTSNSDQLGVPASVLPSVNIGVSAKPWKKDNMYLLTAMDMDSINQPDSFSKKLNLGMEWGWRSILKVQTGLHQGYATGGVQFDVGLINLRLVTYSEELGSVAGTTESRRYAMQIKLLI